jgi:hypothetical protein
MMWTEPEASEEEKEKSAAHHVHLRAMELVKEDDDVQRSGAEGRGGLDCLLNLSKKLGMLVGAQLLDL